MMEWAAIIIQVGTAVGALVVVLVTGGRWMGRLDEKMDNFHDQLTDHTQQDSDNFAKVHEDIRTIDRKVARIEGRQNGSAYGNQTP